MVNGECVAATAGLTLYVVRQVKVLPNWGSLSSSPAPMSASTGTTTCDCSGPA